jgi:hypothetical protein
MRSATVTQPRILGDAAPATFAHHATAPVWAVYWRYEGRVIAETAAPSRAVAIDRFLMRLNRMGCTGARLRWRHWWLKGYRLRRLDAGTDEAADEGEGSE